MKRSIFITGKTKKPDISKLLGCYIRIENGDVHYVNPESILAKDGTIATRKRLTWPSDSLMNIPCAWMPAFPHWIDLSNGEKITIETKERRLNPVDKTAYNLHVYKRKTN